jgi:hypothetical protein
LAGWRRELPQGNYWLAKLVNLWSWSTGSFHSTWNQSGNMVESHRFTDSRALIGMSSTIEIFDPRHGNNWETKDALTGYCFSTLQHPFLVAYSTHLDWPDTDTLLDELPLSACERGFVMVEPWRPNANLIFDAMAESFGQIDKFNYSAMSEFSMISQNLRKAFEIREKFGGWNSGVWCFGASKSNFSRPRQLSRFKAETWSFTHILQEPENIGFALELGELHQSTLILRLGDGVDAWLQRLREYVRL